MEETGNLAPGGGNRAPRIVLGKKTPGGERRGSLPRTKIFFDIDTFVGGGCFLCK